MGLLSTVDTQAQSQGCHGHACWTPEQCDGCSSACKEGRGEEGEDGDEAGKAGWVRL